MGARLSVVINTLNEEKNIRACLDSVRWADEIVIVDMYSDDGTVEICKEYTDRIYFHERTGYVEPAREFAISKASHEFVLVLDADERIPESLARTIQVLIAADDFDYALIPRKNFIFGKWIQHTGWWPAHQIRLFRKGCVAWSDKIHSQPEARGRRVVLSAPDDAIIHLNYETVEDFIARLNCYTNVEATQMGESVTGLTWPKALITLPSRELVDRLWKQVGYRDGPHGLLLSLLMAFYRAVQCSKALEQKGLLCDDQPYSPNGFALEIVQTLVAAFHHIIAHIPPEVEKRMPLSRRLILSLLRRITYWYVRRR